ncbi:MAG: isoprenylcysteine carboxylmethyltransferase family protein [Candidatus Acidiferrales bacterium]
MTGLDKLRLTAFAVVVASWLGFSLVFFLARRKLPAKTQEAKRDPASYWGIAIQTVAIFMVWAFHRSDLGPILPMLPGPQWAQAAILIAAMLIAVFSLWLSIAAVRTLGKQWTYVARVIEGHRLITEGPYNLVRNPIYLSMFGSLVATGLVFGKWWAFLPAVIIFLIGTQIRISREEKLLCATFGDEWTDYTRRVPAFFPGF